MNQRQRLEDFLSNQNTANLAANLCIGVMSFCLLIVIVQVGEQLLMSKSLGYLLWFGFAVVAEALYANAVINIRDEKSWIYRIVEIGLILVLLKIIQLVVNPMNLRDVFISWQADFGNFANGEYLITSLIILLIWFHTTNYLNLLSILNSYESDIEVGEFVQLREEREMARSRMVNGFLMVGVALIILITLAQQDVQVLKNFQGEVMLITGKMVILPLVFYFLSGLILISLSRFSILRGGWLINKIHIQPDVAKRWLRNTVLFFGAIMLVSLFLPTNYTKDFLRVSAYGFQFVFELVMFIFSLILFPFIWLYTVIASLFQLTNETPERAAMPEFVPPAQQPEMAQTPNWLEMLQHIGFWLILIAVVLTVIIYYIRQNKGALGVSPLRRLWRWLSGLFGSFWGWVVQTGEKVEAIFKHKSADEDVTEEKAGFFSRFQFKTGKLSPREKMIEQYEKFLHDTEQIGAGKRPGQTPSQYAAHIDESLGREQHIEITEVTNAFIKARYSLESIGEENVKKVEPLWKRILRRLKQTIIKSE